MPRATVALVAAFGLALVAAVGLRLALLERPPHMALDMLVDDAYISLSVARSLGAGEGLRSSRTATSGVQPLYVLLAAPIYATMTDEERAETEALDRAAYRALALLALADLAAGALLALYCWRAFGRVSALVSAVAWALHPMALAWSQNGLETSVALACLIAALYMAQFHLVPSASPREEYATGAVLAVACLARIDLAVCGAVALLVVLWRLRRAPRPLGRAARTLARVGAGFAALYAPWELFLYAQTGELWPVSGEASAYLGYSAQVTTQRLGGDYQGLLLERAARNLLFRAPWFAALAAVSALGLAAAWRRVPEARRVWGFVFVAAVLLPAYVFGHGVWWYLERYMAPVFAAEVVCVAAGLGLAARRWPRVAAPLAAVAVAAACLASPALRALFERDGSATSYRRAGIWAKESIAPGTAVGAWESGALAYYATELDVVNVDGVVDAAAYRAVRARELDRYLAGRGVRLVVGARFGDNFIRKHASGPVDSRAVAMVPAAKPGGRAWKLSTLAP